ALRIEKSIAKANEDIRSKGITRGIQEVENRKPRGHTVPSCVCTCPWKCLGNICQGPVRPHATLTHPSECKVKAAYFIDSVPAWYHLAE
ncbi:hypothetical protein PIB30_090623, partial [Stylosanthes scabra]|nr:hypothetical protein [Stylosanthes scabra]